MFCFTVACQFTVSDLEIFKCIRHKFGFLKYIHQWFPTKNMVNLFKILVIKMSWVLPC